MQKNKQKGNFVLGSMLKNILSGDESPNDGIDLELCSDRYINVDGCTEIEEYDDTYVVFRGKNMRVIVCGSNIELFTFADGRIKASGKLCKIILERDRDND